MDVFATRPSSARPLRSGPWWWERRSSLRASTEASGRAYARRTSAKPQRQVIHYGAKERRVHVAGGQNVAEG